MPLQATSGAASYDAFGGGAAAVPNYIEDVFSTYLYTGNGSTQTITNGIDLSGKGGLTWIKSRSNIIAHYLFDTSRGTTNAIFSNSISQEQSVANSLTAFNTNGFSIGSDVSVNTNAATYASWTFRKQPKFFDVVTYTGNGANRTIAHNLGSVPGCIIVKRLDGSDGWQIYHRSLANTQYLVLNSSAAVATDATRWNSTTPTSTEFSLGTSTLVNTSGSTYVAYVFAHNAGGFGLTNTDNVISCGTFTSTSGGGANVTLGYEPQWILFKRSDSSTGGSWNIIDNMRGWSLSATDTGSAPTLLAQSNAVEGALASSLTSTGFKVDASNLAGSAPFIYIAIRRGPMKVPTTGTSVFDANASAGTGSTRFLTTGFSVDLSIASSRSGATHVFSDRLRGGGLNSTRRVYSQLTNAEDSTSGGRGKLFDSNTGITLISNTDNGSGDNYIYYGVRRAPSFFDEVCYTEGSAIYATNHNLGILPELIIYKTRSAVRDWFVYYKNPSSGTYNRYMALNLSDAASINYEDMSTLTSTTIPAHNYIGSGNTDVAYLFATCAGVSKVFSYTGNGSSQTINCGFTGGARFVLIKRTDDVGDWYVWDSARGIVSGNDPHLSLNSTAAEVTSDDTIDTDSTGFVVNQVSATNVNVSSATYIGLAIA